MVAMETRGYDLQTDEHWKGVFSICPECGERTEPTSDGWSTNMYCAACDVRWRFTMGWVSRLGKAPTSERGSRAAAPSS
jgi:hypothetical protein